MLMATVASVLLFSQLDFTKTFIYEVPWLTMAEKRIMVGVALSSTTVAMALVVSIISFLVHIYSIGYMADDINIRSYFALLGFFTFAMLGLVWSNNLLITFCFWELVGYSSYRLIGFWNTKPTAIQAATKSFLINRVADAGFLLGIITLYSIGSLDISAWSVPVDSYWMTFAVICIFIGVMGKSAQFPFFTWLPDAMQGPTPVSALIHAATMVAAGIFILVRIQLLLTPTAMMVMASVGAITALVGGVAALFQYDIKKILAYSTMSQLGLMIIAIGSGSFDGGYLHLLNHAFFKAGLFLAAGALIHHFHFTTQDIREMGGATTTMRLTLYCLIICASALAAIPFTSGFVSKEIILSNLIDQASQNQFALVITIATVLISLLTVVYSFRLWWYLEAGSIQRGHDVPLIMRIPMIVLSIASIAILVSFNPFHISGWMDLFMGIRTDVSFRVTMLSISIVLIGTIAGYFLFRHRTGRTYPAFLQDDFLYIDKFYEQTFIQPILRMSELTLKIDSRVLDGALHQITFVTTSMAHLANWFDRYIIDLFLVGGAAWVAKTAGLLARSIVTGKIQYYLLWALALFLIFMISLLYF